MGRPFVDACIGPRVASPVLSAVSFWWFSEGLVQAWDGHSAFSCSRHAIRCACGGSSLHALAGLGGERDGTTMCDSERFEKMIVLDIRTTPGIVWRILIRRMQLGIQIPWYSGV